VGGGNLREPAGSNCAEWFSEKKNGAGGGKPGLSEGKEFEWKERKGFSQRVARCAGKKEKKSLGGGRKKKSFLLLLQKRGGGLLRGTENPGKGEHCPTKTRPIFPSQERGGPTTPQLLTVWGGGKREFGLEAKIYWGTTCSIIKGQEGGIAFYLFT